MANRPAGVPFFARISSLEIACPDCDTVHICKTNQRGTYDPFTSTFHCRRCSAIFVLGVLAYRTSRYFGGTAAAPPPADRIPSLRQSAQLRAHLHADQRELAASPYDPYQAAAEYQARIAPPPPKTPPAPKPPKFPAAPKPSRNFFSKARAAKSLDGGGGLRLPKTQRYTHGQPVNVIVAGVCRCQVVDGDMSPVVAPDCPIHSVRAKEQG